MIQATYFTWETYDKFWFDQIYKFYTPTTETITCFFPGSMLGGSIYVLTGAVMNRRTGPAVFLAYILAGCVALLNSLNYSELACRIPKVRRLSLLTLLKFAGRNLLCKCTNLSLTAIFYN